MTFFEMEGYKEGERYPECTVRYKTFKEAVEQLSHSVGGLGNLSRVVIYYVGQAHPRPSSSGFLNGWCHPESCVNLS